MKRAGLIVALATSAVLVACSAGGGGGQGGGGGGESGPSTTARSGTTSSSPVAVASASGAKYLGDYDLIGDTSYARVRVANGVRTIRTNAVPNHVVGKFPNANNSHAVAAQDLTWKFPTTPTWTGASTPTPVSGVAINGVRFAPTTGQAVTCKSGETYSIEAIGGTFNLGLDNNKADVSPSGEYTYRGAPAMLINANANANEADLVLLGFAPDGYLIYYSKSGAYKPGYKRAVGSRTGTNCTSTVTNQPVKSLQDTKPDGSYTSDWVWKATNGDLDECNGTEIEGTYAYIVTDGYPFIGRCLNGKFDPAALHQPG